MTEEKRGGKRKDNRKATDKKKALSRDGKRDKASDRVKESNDE